MDSLKNIIFKKTSFSDLLEEIYNNQKKRENQVISLIQDLKPLVKDIGDATLLVPLIKEYLDIGVKNDDHLIKLATIVQRIVSNSSQSGDGIITEEEKNQLLKEVDKLKNK